MVRQKEAELGERHKRDQDPVLPSSHELHDSVLLPACLPRLCSLMVSVWAPGLTSVDCMPQAPCLLASGRAPPMGRLTGDGGERG